MDFPSDTIEVKCPHCGEPLDCLDDTLDGEHVTVKDMCLLHNPFGTPLYGNKSQQTEECYECDGAVYFSQNEDGTIRVAGTPV